MPPKKPAEVSIVDIPDQPPTLETDGYMDDLLSKARCDNILAVEAGVVTAIGLQNYRRELRQGIQVDFIVEAIVFAATHGYGPKKTLSLLNWLQGMKKSIEVHHGDDTEARELLKSFLVSNTEKYIRETNPVVDEGSGAADGATGAPSPAAPAPAAPGKKVDPKPSAKGAPPPAPAKEDPALSARNAHSEIPYISTTEVAPLAAFVARSLLQHARLFAYVANHSSPVAESEQPRSFTFAVETPMRPLPLSRALTSTDVDAIHKVQEQKAIEELQRLQAEEAASLEAARVAEEQRQAEIRRLEEEERANQLYFSKTGTGPAIDMVQQELEHQLSQRQRDILVRIAKLEMDMNAVLGK